MKTSQVGTPVEPRDSDGYPLADLSATVTRRDNYTSAQTDVSIVTVSAGSRILVTREVVTCDNANTVDVAVRIGFGTVNTPTNAGVLISHPGIAPGSGIASGNGWGVLGVGADGEDLRVTMEAPTGGSVDVVTTYRILTP